MSTPGRLFVVCGLPGSGKTTRAKQMEAQYDAVRFCPDEWMIDLWDQELRAVLESNMWVLAQRFLAAGLHVVVEFGSWSRVERDELRNGARALGAAVELHYLDAPIAELARRVDARGREGITLAHLERWASEFDVPTPGELSLFDAPYDAF